MTIEQTIAINAYMKAIDYEAFLNGEIKPISGRVVRFIGARNQALAAGVSNGLSQLTPEARAWLDAQTKPQQETNK